MFSRKRIHDKYTSWKKLFLQNWSLFKASRIGLVGLAIMIGFVVIALLAPFMGLRDPLYWLAPESDTIEVAEWWPLEVRPGSPLFGINGSVERQIGFRLSPAAFDPASDRIYVAQGNRLFAFLTSSSNPAWSDGPIVADSRISTDPVVINYGSHRDPAQAYYLILFATEAGTVYAAGDGVGFSTPVPVTRNLGSAITALAGLSADQFGDTNNDFLFDVFVDLKERDSFVVGTEDGRVFAYTVNPPYNVTTGFFRELWNTSLAPSTHVHAYGAVVRMDKSSPVSSLAFYDSNNVTELGRTVYLGTGDGKLWSLSMADGSVQWGGFRQVLTPAPGTVWTSPPVVSVAPEVGGTPTVVYAAGRDYDATTQENVSKVFVLYADTGEPLDTWAAEYPDGGIPIGAFLEPDVLNVRGLEEEVVHAPAVSGTNIFITSESGWLYSVARDPVLGANDEIVRRAGTVQWAYRDDSYRQDGGHKTYFAAAPQLFPRLRLVVVAGNYNNGTPGTWDDRGIVYVFGEGGSLTWKKTFEYAILASPSVWPDPVHTREAVWFGTTRGDVYSYSSTGQYLAPLPPSWARPGGYPSGEYYVFGTDARGRDIFSQLIWGSRIALLVGFASAFFTISIGVIIGLVAGYLGGRVESILMRFTDVILVIPGLPLVIILAAVLGAGVGNIILVIAIVGWPGVARVIRAEVLSLKERPFIDSARVTGASNVRIMFRHIAPNVAPLAFLYMTFAVSGAILTEAALSFIGLGDVNTISWGIMLQDVSQSKALQAWWWLLPPGLAITLISLAFFLVGRAFDEIVNPRLRKR